MSRDPHAKPTPLPPAFEWTRPQDGGLPSYQWRWFDNVKGWSDDYVVGILFALIGDTPRVVGLQLVPRQTNATLPRNLLGQVYPDVYAKRGRGLEDFGESLKHLVLTTNQLQKVPLQELANAAWDSFCEEIVPLEDEFVANISKDEETKWERAAIKHDPRAVVTVAEVARLYLEASGRNPRDAVAKQLCVGLRTVDRYIKKARREGLLPPVHPNAVRSTQTRVRKTTTKKGHPHAKKVK